MKQLRSWSHPLAAGVVRQGLAKDATGSREEEKRPGSSPLVLSHMTLLSLIGQRLKTSKDREAWKTNVASHSKEQNRRRWRKDLSAIRPWIPHFISFCRRENADFRTPLTSPRSHSQQVVELEFL